MDTAAAAPPVGDEGDGPLLARGERIERLLEELKGMAGPSTWPRIEELVRALVQLYGAGLGRILHHASEEGLLGARLQARLCADALVSSLLLLHGLHPEPTEARVRRAVEALRARLGAAGAALELVEVAPGGVVTLRLAAGSGGCPSSRQSVEAAVERAILEAAPEVTRIEVQGAEPAGGGRLVTIGAPRGRPA